MCVRVVVVGKRKEKCGGGSLEFGGFSVGGCKCEITLGRCLSSLLLVLVCGQRRLAGGPFF